MKDWQKGSYQVLQSVNVSQQAVMQETVDEQCPQKHRGQTHRQAPVIIATEDEEQQNGENLCHVSVAG